MKQIKVRRGIDIAQNLFQNINFNRGRSQPPRTKETSLKQQSEGKQEQKQQEGQTNQQQSPRLTDQKLKGGAVGSSHGSKSIILEQVGSSKNSGAIDSSKHSGALHESQLQRLGINQSVAQIHTLSQLNSERGSVHDHHLPGNQRPSMPPFSPQRAVRNSQRPMGLFDRLSSIHRSNTSSHKQKGGSSVQPAVRNHAGTESQPTFNLQQDQITVLSSKRNTRNFESKLGQAIKNIEGGPAIYREPYRKNATESQLMTASAQQKIVNVASHDKTMESYVNSQGRNKKSKRGQKAVVQKYQQIPQSMISSNRPTFQQLEKAQSISNISSFSDKVQMNSQEQQHDNERGINHIRQYYQDENYRSSPGGQKAAEMKKFRVAVGGHAKGNSIVGLEHEMEGGKGSAKVPSSSEKPRTKVQFKSKPPQLATGDERDYQSPQFTQTAQSQNHSVERPRRFGSDVTDIESQSQHMSQWRRNQFPQDQSSQAQGVQHYKVVNFRPYQEEVESLKVNNTNMAADKNAAASSKRTSKQSISSPKPAFPSQQASSQTTEKPRTQSYYQRILNQIKRSPKSRGNEQQIQFREGEQAGANESSSQLQHSTSGIVQDPADIPELQIHLSNSSNLTQMKKHNIEKIPQKHRSAVQFQQVQTPCFQNQGKHKPLMDSQMKTIPIELIPDKINSHIDGEEQRVSDLFSPARGKMDGKHQQHNTMTHSQIQNLKNSSEGLKNFTIDINNDVNRRYTKPSMAQDKNTLRVEKQGSDNQSQVYQQTRDVNDYFGAQSVAISPSNRVRMYDEMLNATPQTVNQQSHLKVHQQASSKSGPFNRYRKQQSEDRFDNSQIDDNNKTGNSDQNAEGTQSSQKQGGNYSLFNFRRKQGALKSNERQQSPRASSKQILAKQNLSRLTKPFSKNRAAEKSVSGQHGASSGVFELDNRSKEDSNRKREFKPVGSLEQLKRNSKENKAPSKQVNNTGGDSHGLAVMDEHHQSSILFGSSRDSCDIEATGSKAANKTVRIISDSCSPQRPAVTKFKHKTEGDGEIDRQTGGHIIGSQEDRGANADLRMRNKKNIMSNIKQVHQNYKNNKLKKMDNQNNTTKLVNKQQSDTPPRKHTNKFSFDQSDRDCISGEDGLQKVRTTLNSSKLKDQETASGATKQTSACLQSSIQGQQIGDGALDEKDGGDDKDISNNNLNDDPDQEVKGWTIFKLKSWKNIFVKSNEKSRENDTNGENKTGENNDTKDDETMDKDTTQQLKIKGGITNDDNSSLAVREEPSKDLKASATSSEDQVVMELKEMKHNIQCDCDKDATYCFACKNGVVWFAANVIALKIRRQQKLNDKVDVSKIILEEYEKCKKHYKSLKKLKPKQESALQIDRDLGRTFPKNKFFNPGQPGYRKLRNVLRAFSCYDDQADYVQGMNFLVGQLLMHCSATLAFWLFVELIEECELRDIYQVGLPGLHKHSFIINMLVKDHLPDLHKHFEEHNVVPEMYASDWIFGLFASILPENQTNVTAHFFSLFFQYKWEFFYKLILSILEHLKPKLMEAQDMFTILQQIKIAMSNKNDPYTYGLIYQQEQQIQGSQKNRNKYTDHEMEDILGSIVSGQEDNDGQQINPAQQPSLFSNIANFFKKSKDDGDREPVWQEFPWEQVIVKTDIILKWKKVDMKKINRLHANFDLDTGKFVNIEEERQQQEQQAKLGAAIATSLDKHQYNDKE